MSAATTAPATRPKRPPSRSALPRPAADLLAEPPGGVGADRDERAVREVEDAHQAVDERQPRGDEEVHRPQPEAGDRQEDEGAQCPPPWTPSSRRTCSGSESSSAAGPGVDDPAAVEDDDVACEALHHRQVLLDEQDRGQLGGTLEHRGDLGHEERREALRRLVDEEHLVPVQERPRDRDHLLLAARERPGALPARCRSSGNSS